MSPIIARILSMWNYRTGKLKNARIANVRVQWEFAPEINGNNNASDLLQQVMEMNKGNYLDPDLVVKTPLKFCVGVACYPEKHSEAPNLETDIHYLKLKQDLGAEYAVTQMFFDNKKYFNFLDKCR